MQKYDGRCHCGAVKFSFEAPRVATGMRCDCSICRRKGIAMSVDLVPPSKIEIHDPENVLQVYRFGTGTARHHFCGRCGIHVFVETRLNKGQYRINLGCVDVLDTLALPIEIYDGKSI